jgi:hypothetical protein
MIAKIIVERWSRLEHTVRKEDVVEKYLEWGTLRINFDTFRHTATQLHGQITAALHSYLISTAAQPGRYRLGEDDAHVFEWDGDILHPNTIVFSGFEWLPLTNEEITRANGRIMKQMPPGTVIREITIVVQTDDEAPP